MKRVLCDEAWAVNALVGRSAVTGDMHVALLRELGTPLISPRAVTRQESSGGSAGTSFHLTTRESQILRLVWKGGFKRRSREICF
jgi:hypothetical protein